jgi:XTP/dITP diphosphohydrolase
MRLLIATNNPGKRVELQALLAGIELVTPAELGIALQVPEDGPSFAANARLKARAFATAAGMVALADDSGLEVDALGGAPGVHSARYGGPGLNDTGRCGLLLDALQPYPRPEDRAARFRCWVTALAPDGRCCEAEGVCEGRIGVAAVGTGGFGYDPVFYLPAHDRTMAELPAELKNQLSHRARAVRAIHPCLLERFPELLPSSPRPR